MKTISILLPETRVIKLKYQFTIYVNEAFSTSPPDILIDYKDTGVNFNKLLPTELLLFMKCIKCQNNETKASKWLGYQSLELLLGSSS